MKMVMSLFFCLFSLYNVWGQKVPKFKVIALYENGGHHIEYSKAAKIWLDKLAAGRRQILPLIIFKIQIK